MKQHKDFLYTILGISVIVLLIFITHKSRQSEPIQLNFTEQSQTREHELVGEILDDTESFAVAEDAAVENKPQKTSLPDTSVPLPVAGAPLPVAWESTSAPNISEVELSPSLQRSLAASVDLRTEQYTNPSSELNLRRVEDLRAIRKNRHKTE